MKIYIATSNNLKGKLRPPFRIAAKGIKYLGISQTEEVRAFTIFAEM
jgi:hypothetical protein